MKLNTRVIAVLEAALEVQENAVLQKPENKALVEKLLNKLREFQAADLPFVLFFQPGAGAPVQEYIKQWMSEGLGGCTGELCAISTLDIKHVVINTMTENEQATANAKIKGDKKVDVSQSPIFNDPDRIFAILFDMLASELKTVNNRTAYLPQAVICTSAGLITKLIQNAPLAADAARDSNEYLKTVQREVQAAQQLLSSSSFGIFAHPVEQQKSDEEHIGTSYTA